MQKLFEDFINKLREEEDHLIIKEEELQIYKEELIQRQEELDERQDKLDEREKRLNIRKRNLDDLEANLKIKSKRKKKSGSTFQCGSNKYQLKNGWFHSNGKPVDKYTQKQLKKVFKNAFTTAFNQPNSFFVDGYDFNDSDSYDSDDNRPEGY